MTAPQNRPDGAAEPDQAPEEDHGTGAPDGDSPHDVPDEKVIEKTLPTTPVPERGDDGSRSR